MSPTTLLLKVIGTLNTILSLLGLIQGNGAKSAQENVPFHIDTVTSEMWALASDSAVGLAAIKAQLLIIDAHISSVDSSLAASIAGRQSGTTPVILPTTPPAGYGGPSSGTIAYDVWNFVFADGYQAQIMTESAGLAAVNLSTIGAMFQTMTTPWYRHGGAWTEAAGPSGYNSDPVFPIASILSTDTLPVFLDRESYYTGWADPIGSGYYSVDDGSGSGFVYVTTITAAEFIVLRDGVTPGAALLVPPVWPGLPLVTLGTPVALSTGLTITTPMDGAIVNLASEPAKAGFFTFDDVNSYRNLGALSFFDDDNNQEPPQSLGFTDAQYCPKTMVRARGVKVRCVGGVVGTITPWVIA